MNLTLVALPWLLKGLESNVLLYNVVINVLFPMLHSTVFPVLEEIICTAINNVYVW